MIRADTRPVENVLPSLEKSCNELALANRNGGKYHISKHPTRQSRSCDAVCYFRGSLNSYSIKCGLQAATDVT